jgi:hypothetical protein
MKEVLNMPTQNAKLAKPANVIDLAHYRTGKAVTTAPQEPPNDDEWHNDLAQWVLDRCRERPDILWLNDREQEFLRSMTSWPSLPTERQAWWLEKIEAKVLKALKVAPNPPPPAA